MNIRLQEHAVGSEADESEPSAVHSSGDSSDDDAAAATVAADMAFEYLGDDPVWAGLGSFARALQEQAADFPTQLKLHDWAAFLARPGTATIERQQGQQQRQTRRWRRSPEQQQQQRCSSRSKRGRRRE